MASMGRSVWRDAERMLIHPASTRPLWTAKTVSDGEAETASVCVCGSHTRGAEVCTPRGRCKQRVEEEEEEEEEAMKADARTEST